MQASSVFLNTKPLLAPIYAGNRYGKDNRNCNSNTIQLNRAQLKQPVTWRHTSRRCCSRAYLVNSKNTSKIYHSETNHEGQRVSRYCCYKRKQIGINGFTSGFFADKSTFPLSKLKPYKDKVGLHVRQLHVSCAAVGPNEPHAASTTWPDGVTEKQSLDGLDPEVERREYEQFLRLELPSHPKLHRGQLKNGLRYLILPNKVPPNRFEAHMEVHVGSIDEEDDEQGIAHMIEHVAFLGSKKREKLLGTGARSNAYTDFHHTVFHIHSPTSTKIS